MNVTQLAQALIRCPSVTPQTAGVFDVMAEFLSPLGFTIHRMTFAQEGSPPVENFYARYGTAMPIFCFAGHTDVVPPGNPAAWSHPPFAGVIADGELYGRGAEDMKGAVAAFMVAAREFIAANSPFTGSISLLITQDEEGAAINGTRPMLGWLAARGERLSACIVGEPTNPDTLGQMAKIGRRGSVNFHLTVDGTQGHVAYPERADNPVPRLVAMLHRLAGTAIDAGTPEFPPSHLEITSVDVGNPTTNLIPARAEARFNVRFNAQHTGAQIVDWVHAQLHAFGPYSLDSRISGEAFLCEDAGLRALVRDSVRQATGQTPEFSTTGGTSDARFIKDYCPVIEFGATGRTPHQVNERVALATLDQLRDVYREMLARYFA